MVAVQTFGLQLGFVELEVERLLGDQFAGLGKKDDHESKSSAPHRSWPLPGGSATGRASDSSVSSPATCGLAAPAACVASRSPWPDALRSWPTRITRPVRRITS